LGLGRNQHTSRIRLALSLSCAAAAPIELTPLPWDLTPALACPFTAVSLRRGESDTFPMKAAEFSAMMGRQSALQVRQRALFLRTRPCFCVLHGIARDLCAVCPRPRESDSVAPPCSRAGATIVGPRSSRCTRARRNSWSFVTQRPQRVMAAPPLPLPLMPQHLPTERVNTLSPAACSDVLGPGSVEVDGRLLGAAVDIVCGLPLFTFLSLRALY
jgi:hypothetical protein